jgi:heme/copper-type cytochrome/quinol oxidase subunit 2
MPVVVDVRPQADFDRWLKEQQAGTATQATAAAAVASVPAVSSPTATGALAKAE